jgi:hypothetical protein
MALYTPFDDPCPCDACPYDAECDDGETCRWRDEGYIGSEFAHEVD